MIRRSYKNSYLFFFFQAEDGIRDYKVTGVQTCALPIYLGIEALPALGGLAAGLGRRLGLRLLPQRGEGRHPVVVGGQRAKAGVVGIGHPLVQPRLVAVVELEIGRASCRERV